MQLVKGKKHELYELAMDESVPEDMIKNDSSFYLFRQNGVLMKLRNSPIHSMLSKFEVKKGTVQEFLDKNFEPSPYNVEKFSYLVEERWDEFKFPQEEFAGVMAYFREIFAKHKTESCVILMVNFESKDWKVLYVPQMDCSHGGVNYVLPTSSLDSIEDIDKGQRYYKAVFKNKVAKRLMAKSYEEYSKLLTDGYRIFGTIHSHCDFDAYHSGIDDADEFDFDGLHITIGHVNSKFSFAARYMVDGVEFPVKIEDIIGDIDSVKKLAANMEPTQYQMDLMMSDLEIDKKTYVCAPRSMGVPSSSDRGTFFPGEWNREYNYVPSSPSIDKDSVEYNLIEEEDVVRLFDLKDGKAFIIRKPYRTQHSVFFNQRYIEIPFGDITEDALQKHQEFLLELEQEQKDTLFANSTKADKIYFIDDPDLNPDFGKKDIEFLEGEELVPTHPYGKAKRKAKNAD